MLPPKQQDHELFWLKPRNQYLETLHGFINQSPHDGLIAKAERQYSNVATSKYLIERLQEVYDGNLS